VPPRSRRDPVGVLAFDPLFSEGPLIHPRLTDDPRLVLAYLGEHIQEGDGIYVYNDAQSVFSYYAPRFGLEKRSFVTGSSSESNWKEDLRDLEGLRGRPRVWLVFTHVHNRYGRPTEEDFFVLELDRMGRRLDAFRAPDAAVYLYDLAIPLPGAASSAVSAAPVVSEVREVLRRRSMSTSFAVVRVPWPP
jgi:hypothetical protein